ncbi:serine/threonine-protein kinase Warts isoform X1 [Drosophila sulfurigaster albostrigata]|uniref:serine/threonine-protein kinase Warts isoform X1 n=1 Tax=Drosophila sulfurigaster albostrigata TaxID=89887 RepID=UPI002D21D1C8|nr:serine/threonine-protein kinase Warts isoform X1 [Drosophila sulfurigaster albostrigata]
MDSHGAKRSAEPNMYEQLAKKIWRPNAMVDGDAQSEELSTPIPTPITSPPPPPPAPPQPQSQPEGSKSMKLPSAESTTSFLAEVLSALYGDTTGHPEHGSLSYHKAAERYALTGDGKLAKRSSGSSSAASSGSQSRSQHLPPGFGKAERALYERNKLAAAAAARQVNANGNVGSNSVAPNASGDAGVAGRAAPSTINELSHIYLQLLQQQLPQQQAQQQQHLVAGAPNNMSMPIYGLACGHVNDLTQVYAQLLAANFPQNVAQQQHQQQQQSSSAAAATILYEAMLQQRVLQQLQQQQMQQHAQQQQQQQQSRTPRGIYGGNYNLSGGNKTQQPDSK